MNSVVSFIHLSVFAIPQSRKHNSENYLSLIMRVAYEVGNKNREEEKLLTKTDGNVS